jgi:WYL domain-containing protein
MQPWIRSWGAQVEVLAPDWLRDRIAAELRQAADQYSCSASPAVRTLSEVEGPRLGRGPGDEAG